jgi:hypothetical protein
LHVSETQQRWKSVKIAGREGEAPAEPFSRATSSGRSGSAGASPSLQGSAIDSLRTGLPHWLTNHHQNRESEYGQFGLSYLLEMISRVFNTERGAVQLI